MARNADPHPEPNDPDEGPTPKFPPGTAPIKDVTPGGPGVIVPEPPAPPRQPFPDRTPDPGAGKR